MSIENKRKAELMAGPYTRLLADHEQAAADFYTSFAGLLHSSSPFWTAMAEEELYHKKLINGIDEKLHSGEWRFKRPRFLTSTILQSIEWVETRQKDVEKNGISMRGALKLALELENTMIECRFFEVLDKDTPEMMSIMESLAAYSRAHLERLQSEARRLKWRIAGWRKVRAKLKAHGDGAGMSRSEVQESVKTAQADMLGLLVSLEEAASGLYSAYSERFAGSSDFWAKLAAEELQHGILLKGLYKLLDQGRVFRNVERFNRRGIEAEIRVILNAEFVARHGKLSIHDAVNMALRVERGITESGFYATVKSDAPEFAVIAARLVGCTKEHLRRLEREVGRTIDLGAEALDDVPAPKKR